MNLEMWVENIMKGLVFHAKYLRFLSVNSVVFEVVLGQGHL